MNISAISARFHYHHRNESGLGCGEGYAPATAEVHDKSLGRRQRPWLSASDPRKEDCLSPMLIKAYRVESRRHGSIAFEPPEPVLIGIVQFTGGIDEGREEEWQRESEAVNLLMNHSPFAHDPMRGADTWDAELIVVDDESLEAPSFDDASERLSNLASFMIAFAVATSRQRRRHGV